MTEQEIPLSGGNITGVVRIGETVHRRIGPWSIAVHGLLRYLEAQGFDGAPRFLGFDEQGREILTFIDGEVGNYPLPLYMWSEAALCDVARFSRRYHDAVAGYISPIDTVWQFEYPDRSQHEIICHNDVAPYNMVYVNERPHALIDFDTAGPGPKLWDIAYAAYRFVPLLHNGDAAIQQLGLTNFSVQSQRLKLFCEAYSMNSPRAVLDMIEPRLQELCNVLLRKATAGDVAYQRMIEEGHLEHYRREIAIFHRHYHELLQSLL